MTIAQTVASSLGPTKSNLSSIANLNGPVSSRMLGKEKLSRDDLHEPGSGSKLKDLPKLRITNN